MAKESEMEGLARYDEFGGWHAPRLAEKSVKWKGAKPGP